MENDRNQVIDDDNACWTTEIETPSELYTVDMNLENNTVVYGGLEEFLEVRDFIEDDVIVRIEDLAESVLYTKFLSKDRILFVTINGAIGCMDSDKEVSIFNIDEEITAAIFTDLHLVIGTLSGQVYLYDEDLEHVNTFGGHSSEIISVDFKENRVLSLSAKGLLVHDTNGRNLYSLKAEEAYCFKYIASDVICFAADKKIRIFKETKKLFETKCEEAVETIELIEKNLVIGGFTEFIQLIDTTGHFATFKLPISSCATVIKKYKDYQIVFTTLDDYIGLIDIRDIKTLRYFPTDLGTVFDIAVGNDKICAVGAGGSYVIDILTAESKELEEMPVS